MLQITSMELQKDVQNPIPAPPVSTGPLLTEVLTRNPRPKHSDKRVPHHQDPGGVSLSSLEVDGVPCCD